MQHRRTMSLLGSQQPKPPGAGGRSSSVLSAAEKAITRAAWMEERAESSVLVNRPKSLNLEHDHAMPGHGRGVGPGKRSQVPVLP